MAPLNNIFSVAAVLAALNGAANAFWRLECRGLDAYARVDPLVDPGMAAAHNHAIHGGSNFGINSNADDLLGSDCTSCSVLQDKSAYWFPSLHFMYPNGTTVMVEQVGGLLAYYFLNSDPGEQITAFPKGFSMVAGTSWRRNFTCQVPEPPKSDWTGYEVSQDALGQKALGFNCLNYAQGHEAEPSLYRHYMPDKDFLDQNCLDGIRLEVMFPSCWNGKDLDSESHKSHVAYPNLVMNGACPDGFPTRLPGLFFESIWNTYAFKDVEGQFVFSNGDTTGYGNHADFVAAWEPGVLQQAVDTCTNPSGEQTDCSVFNLQNQTDSYQNMLDCHFPIPPELKNDNPKGPRQGLPGINPLIGKGLVKGADIALPLSQAMDKTAPAGLNASASGPDVDVDLTASKNGDVDETPADDAQQSPAPAAPAVTSAPSIKEAAVQQTPTAAPSSSESFVTTIYSTDGNNVWQIFVAEATSTVTASAPADPTGAAKRHMHRYHPRRSPHHRRHRS